MKQAMRGGVREKEGYERVKEGQVGRVYCYVNHKFMLS